jgi:DNA repair protein RecO (recombination protein O)
MESAGIATWLNGEALFSGLYLNELLIRLLPAEDPHPAVFDHYAATLLALAEGRPLEPLLRSFEWRLLDDLGYGFSLSTTSTATHRADGLYRLQVDAGLERSTCCSRVCSTAPSCWPWPKPTGPPRRLSAAKRLMRQALAVHLGGRPWSAASCFASPDICMLCAESSLSGALP